MFKKLRAFVILFLMQYILSIKFFFQVPGKTYKCLGEYLTENTLGIYI